MKPEEMKPKYDEKKEKPSYGAESEGKRHKEAMPKEEERYNPMREEQDKPSKMDKR